MAANFRHEITSVDFPFVLIGVIVVLILVMFAIGYFSVTLIPRRQAKKMNQCHWEGSRYPNRDKYAEYRKMYRRYCRKSSGRKPGNAAIALSSHSFDLLLVAVSAVAVAATIMTQHYNGIAQLFINMLADTDAAVWGDILALGAIGVCSLSIAFGIGFFRKKGEDLHVRKLVKETVTGGFMPCFVQRASVLYIIYQIIYKMIHRRARRVPTERKPFRPTTTVTVKPTATSETE